MFTARLSLEIVPVVPLVNEPEPAPLTKLTPLKPPETVPSLLMVVSALVSIADAVGFAVEITPPTVLLIVTPSAPVGTVMAFPVCTGIGVEPVTVTVSPAEGTI